MAESLFSHLLFVFLLNTVGELVALFELFAALFELFDELFGELFGELVSNIPWASSHIYRTLHRAHTGVISFSFMCGLDLLFAKPSRSFC